MKKLMLLVSIALVSVVSEASMVQGQCISRDGAWGAYYLKMNTDASTGHLVIQDEYGIFSSMNDRPEIVKRVTSTTSDVQISQGQLTISYVQNESAKNCKIITVNQAMNALTGTRIKLLCNGQLIRHYSCNLSF